MSARKKVVFCTYSSIYSSKVLEQLIVDTDIDLVAIINSTRVFRPALNPIFGALYQLKISGLRYSSYLFFITDFFKWIQPLLKLRRWPLRSVHAMAKINDIHVIDTRDINSNEVSNFIKKNDPDYLLCAHFNQLLKEPILMIENLQCINIHPSLLPSYKGVDPVFYAMRDNVEEIGVTVHSMDNSFDSGKILLQATMKMNKTKSLLSNNSELFEEGMRLAVSWIKNNKKYPQVSIKNDESSNHYDSWPSRSDIKGFKKSGKRLMNFSGLWKQK